MQKEYRARINRTFDYIEKNLHKPMSLEELASVASFSRFHFTRIFAAIVGETPMQFLQRVRLEKAACHLIIYQERPVTEIALDLGFSDISVFSRTFKNHFGMSPSAFRDSKEANSNMDQLLGKKSQTVGKEGQVPTDTSMYFCGESQTIKWRTNMVFSKGVEVKKLPKMNLAYVRHIGPYKGNEKLFEGLWNKIMAWAGPRGLIGGPDFKSLCVYHDDPGMTDESRLRTSVCITVPEGTKVDGEIGSMELEEATYAVAHFEVDPTQFEQAWNWVYADWFPKSGYQPDDKPPFELYPEEPRDGKFIVDICVPVKPM